MCSVVGGSYILSKPSIPGAKIQISSWTAGVRNFNTVYAGGVQVGGIDCRRVRYCKHRKSNASEKR